MKKLRIGFISGSRSDFSKIRPYLQFLHSKYQLYVFATSMHMQKMSSADCPCASVLINHLPKNVEVCYTKVARTSLARELSELIKEISLFLEKNKISFLFVHGDRVEALAGAAAAACMRVPVCQVEAGDESGNIDETFRHAITKLSNRFLVDDEIAKQVVLAMGEDPKSVYVTGNVLLSVLPTPNRQKAILKKYNLLGKKYIMVLYHPETDLSPSIQYHRAMEIVNLLQKSNMNAIVILPNNDFGAEHIHRAYKHIINPKQRVFYAFTLEEYLTLLQHAVCLVGNSSSTVKEAPLLQVPSILLGDRQRNRFVGRNYPLLHCVKGAKEASVLLKKLYGSAHTAPVPYTKNRFNFRKRLESIFKRDFFFPSLQKEFHSFR